MPGPVREPEPQTRQGHTGKAFVSVISELRKSECPRLILRPHPRRVGRFALLSGSFDPPTIAHMALAEAAMELVDGVALVYSLRTLSKDPGAGDPLMEEEARLRVLERLASRRKGLVVGVSSHGLLLDQVRAARDVLLGSDIFLVMGSDKALQVLDPAWYQDRDSALGALFRQAVVLFAERSGQEGAVQEALARPENARWRQRFVRLRSPAVTAGVSSRAVRDQIRRGHDVSSLIPPEALPFL